MKKLSYYSPDDACHYLYVDDAGNAAYERYSIEEEKQTDHLNNLSDEEMEQWLVDAYDAEEEQMENEEAFVDKFLEHFDVHETADEAVAVVTVEQYNDAMDKNPLWVKIADATNAGPMWMHDSGHIDKIMEYLADSVPEATKEQVIEYLDFAADIEY